ncbi:hypothetical protein [Pyxidicoccus xibeiensis]|uniref:hypothetical protein n=1 Tax=Pyxidicoccus xibeiensis TaxID=2906759 RepID=UPI0020A6EF68|nr:hypothetical protein [Pyxidicoccus xibeiensis]MCP3143692.1 hypothetical protein [Pyxidicoccus xibeiensis]
MSREENTRYVVDTTTQLTSKVLLGRFRSPKALLGFLGGLWLLLVVVFVVMYSLLQGDGRPAPESPVQAKRSSPSLPNGLLFVGVFALSVGGALGFGAWKRKQSIRAYAKGLRSPEPSALLVAIDQMFPKQGAMADFEVFRVQARAVACVLYGQVEPARRELRQVSWEGKPPIVRALPLGVESLIQLLCTGEHAQGLTLAREALAMVDLPNAWPGAKQGRAFYEICVRTGEWLTGEATSSTLKELELHHQGTTIPVIRLLSAWGLRVAYHRAGDMARAEEMRRFLQEQAPHCQPLQQLPA